MTRKDFEMTEEDLETLLEAMKPVPMIMLQCGEPPSQQERVNAAWKHLGDKMGFKYMTVQPNGKGDRFFSAEVIGYTAANIVFLEVESAIVSSEVTDAGKYKTVFANGTTIITEEKLNE